jgi:hypothetical protein
MRVSTANVGSRKVNRALSNSTHYFLVILTLFLLYFNSSLKANHRQHRRHCSRHVGNEKCKYNFGQRISREETTWKT